jgi:hypothetical protein
MRLITKTEKLRTYTGAIAGITALTILSLSQITHAASLSQVFVRFDRMQVSTATTGTVCAKPSVTATEAHVVVSFPTGYTLGAAGTFTVSTTNLAWPTGGTAWPSIATATAVASQDVTFPSGDLTAGTLYCFNWINTAAVTVTSGASSTNIGNVATTDSGNATIESAQYATASITNDQIVVTATIPPAFSFALSGNTDSLGNLSSAAVTPSPTPRTATVGTNAKNGWMVWAKDSTTGLYSASASYTLASTTPGTHSTLATNTPGYNTGVTATHASGTGTVSVDSIFDGTTQYQGGGLDTSLRKLASSTGTASSDVLTLTNNASINNATPAANDYTDTITVVGAGLF